MKIINLTSTFNFTILKKEISPIVETRVAGPNRKRLPYGCEKSALLPCSRCIMKKKTLMYQGWIMLSHRIRSQFSLTRFTVTYSLKTQNHAGSRGLKKSPSSAAKRQMLAEEFIRGCW